MKHANPISPGPEHLRCRRCSGDVGTLPVGAAGVAPLQTTQSLMLHSRTGKSKSRSFGPPSRKSALNRQSKWKILVVKSIDLVYPLFFCLTVFSECLKVSLQLCGPRCTETE